MRHCSLLSVILVACTGRGDDSVLSNLEACVLSNVEPVCAASPVPLTTSAAVEDAPQIALGVTYEATAPGGTGFVVFTPEKSGTYTLYSSIDQLRFCDEEPICFSTDFDCSPMNRALRYDLVQGLPHEIELRDPGTFWFHLTFDEQTVDFAPPQLYGAGTTPMHVSTGDLDNDGVLDLAVSTPDDAGGSTTIDLLQGDGSGAFEMVGQVSTSAPSNTVLSDFNADGLLDIVGLAVDGQGPLPGFYLEGRGNFQFANLPRPTGIDFLGPVSAADFDGDGTLELVASYVDTTTIDGPGGFVVLDVPSFEVIHDEPAFGRDTGHAVTGDFNGDGHADVLVGHDTEGAARIYFGDGSGGLAFGFEQALTGVGVYRFGAADLDGDGLTDVVTIHDDNTIIISHSEGSSLMSQTVPPSVALGTIGFGDFNRDGRTDIAIAGERGSDSGGIGIYVAREGRAFERAGVLEGPPRSRGLAIGDFNGDGHDDLATTALGAVAVYESR
jgi:hypothetical protein